MIAYPYIDFLSIYFCVGSRESINDQLNCLVQEAEKKSEDLMARILKCSTFGNLPAAQLKELEKEYHIWEKLYKKFRKMRTEYTQISKLKGYFWKILLLHTVRHCSFSFLLVQYMA